MRDPFTTACKVSLETAFRALLLGLGLLAACQAHTSQTNMTKPQPPEVLVLRNPASQQAVFRVVFRSGAVDDPEGRAGLTTLTARMMAEGGTQSLTSAELLKELYPLGGHIDVQVDKEVTVFIGRVSKDAVKPFLDIFSDVLIKPRWDGRELARLRDEMVSDIEQRLRTSDDEDLSKEALYGLIFGSGHPYGTYNGGTRSGLKAITLEDMKKHADRVFGRRRMLVGAAGDVSDSVVKDLSRRLAVLGEGAPASEGTALPAPKPPTAKLLLVEKEAASTAMALGYPYPVDSAGLSTVGRGKSDWPALVLAFSALGEHRHASGRLYNRLREQRGLNYGDYAYPEHFVQEGWGKLPLPNMVRRQQHVLIWVRPVEAKNQLFALRAVRYELERFAKEGLTDEEVERTKKFLAGQVKLWALTDSRRLGYALDEKLTTTPDYLESLAKSIAKLTTAQVNAAISRHFQPDKLVMAVVTKDAAAFRRAVLAGKPTPISYQGQGEKPAALLAEDKKIAASPWKLSDADIAIVPASKLFE